MEPNVIEKGETLPLATAVEKRVATTKRWGVAITLSLLALWLGGCQGKHTPFEASGRPLELAAVIPDSYHTEAFKDSVRGAFAGPVPALPQREPYCDVLFTTHSKFSSLYKIFRNILYIEIDSTTYTKPALHISRDEWASGQLIVTLKAPNLLSMHRLLSSQKARLEKLFYDEELKRKATPMKSTYSSAMQTMVKDSIGGILINPPVDIKYLKGMKDFVWGSSLGRNGRMDIVVYTFPYTDPNTFTPNGLIHYRDSVMMRNMPGEYPNSYMITEKRATPLFRSFTLDGSYRAELRGLWAMEGDMMGGPFVMHAVVDQANQRVIVAEAFVYAPSKEKRNLLLHAEASLYTLREEGKEFSPTTAFPSSIKKKNEQETSKDE